MLSLGRPISFHCTLRDSLLTVPPVNVQVEERVTKLIMISKCEL